MNGQLDVLSNVICTIQPSITMVTWKIRTSAMMAVQPGEQHFNITPYIGLFSIFAFFLLVFINL